MRVPLWPPDARKRSWSAGSSWSSSSAAAAASFCRLREEWRLQAEYDALQRCVEADASGVVERQTRAALAALDPSLTFEIVAMTTAGDRELHKQLSDWGYKGLFTKELEDALLADQVDLVVHSMKDMPSILPEGLMIAAMLPRADVRDAWISPHHASIAELPVGAVVGTSSARRAAQLLHARPDVQIVPFRGNVDTRLRKLEEGVADRKSVV